MTRSVLPLAGLLICGFVSGCGGDDSSAGPSGNAGETGTAGEPAESVFDPMAETIDKARQVEQLSEDRVRQLNRQLEEAESDKP